MADPVPGQPAPSITQYGYEISGDTAVNITAPNGKRHSIRYIGIGHPWHTISTDDEGTPRGRVSTDAEVALAKALIENGFAALEAMTTERDELREVIERLRRGA